MGDGSILEVADLSSPYPGNFIPSLARLREVVARRLDLETVFVLPEAARDRPWAAALRGAGVPMAFLDRETKGRLRTRKLVSVATEWNARLLHSHFRRFDRDVARASRRIGAKTVVHLHSLYPRELSRSHAWREAAFWRTVGTFRVDRVVAVSDAVAQDALRRGAPRTKMTVIPNGIDLDRLLPNPSAPEGGLRAGLGIPEGAAVVLAFAGWSPFTKGIDVVARSLPILASGVPGLDVRCVIVASPEARDEVLRMAGGLSNVMPIPPTPSVADLYRAADCFVSASRAEGHPASIGEAMACGLPVVSSDIPGLRSVYGGPGSGVRFVRSEDSRALAEALSSVLRMAPEARRQEGETNREFVRANLGLDRWADRITAVYAALLER